MNRKIKTYRAISYIILFYMAAAFLLLGPCGVLRKDRLLQGQERLVGTAQVRLDRQIQQVFIADGAYLKYLDVYVTSEKSAGKNYHLLVYDELNNRLINREVAMPETPLPGFLRIPLSLETVPGRAYVWQLQGTDTPMDLGVANTGETGLTVFGNYYIVENGETSMLETQNIMMRLTWTDSPSAKKMAVLYGLIAVIGVFFIALAEYTGRKWQKLNKETTVQQVVRLTAGPALAASALYLYYAVFVRTLFGGKKDDKLVYALGIGLAAAFFACVIFAKRKKRAGRSSLAGIVRERGMDWMQSAAFAGVLLGGIHFMNAQYQFYQDIASREILIWSGLLLLTMDEAKAVFRKKNAAFAAVLALAAYAVYRIRLYGMELEGEKLLQAARTPRYDSMVLFAAGLVLLSLISKIRRKAFQFRAVNPWYAGLMSGLLLLLVLFRNTRGWPVYLAVVFGLFYLFFIGWRGRDRLLANFCNGVMLNFAFAVIFCMARRPFRAWVFSRYNFVFHTVTITATYLTLVVCVLTVRLLAGLKKGKRLCDLWGTVLLYGMGMSFLFLTLSRTGYLAVVIMTIVLVPFVTFFCYRQGLLAFGRNIAVMAAAAVLSLPVAYTGVRLLPALYNDPYIFEVEDSAAAIHRDDPKDSTAYMSVSYFKYVMDNKLFADAGTDARDFREFMLCFQDGVRPMPASVLVAGDVESGSGDLDDFSNGRMEIFQRYIKSWNLTGHDIMGVELNDGTLSVHAHNTYLQVIHDHGWLTGAVYLLFGLVSAALLFVFAVGKSGGNALAALPLAVFIGFAVAGLVEWLFHPCNPIGYATMVMLAPLLTFKKAADEESGRDAMQRNIPLRLAGRGRKASGNITKKKAVKRNAE